MNWILNYLRSSVGRKQLMGVTGGIIAFWIFMHMLGNIPLLLDRDAYNAYAHMLTSNKAMLYSMELVMGSVLIAHFYLAISLTRGNRRARPTGYEVSERKGSRSFASFTMIYSGVWILVYLVYHIYSLKFGTYYSTILNGVEVRDIYRTVIEEFSQLWYALFYVVSMTIMAFHLVHAIGSAFQTMGISHPRYNAIIRMGSIAYAAVVSGGFAVIAIGAHIIGRSL